MASTGACHARIVHAQHHALKPLERKQPARLVGSAFLDPDKARPINRSAGPGRERSDLDVGRLQNFGKRTNSLLRYRTSLLLGRKRADLDSPAALLQGTLSVRFVRCPPEIGHRCAGIPARLSL